MTDERSSTLHMPEGPWRFDAEVTRVFDDMLERSIPQYWEMRHLVHTLGRSFIRPGSDVVDLGCSRGGALAPLVQEVPERVRFVGVDVARSMLEAAGRRFATEVQAGVVELQDVDLRDSYPDVMASLTLAVLTLQFTPIEHRHRIVQSIFDSTLEGGALILVEKVKGVSARTDELFADLHRRHKRAGGYSEEAIERKRLSLEGVLMPVTAAWNEDMLRQAGFRQVECFWRWANFAGWLALKPAR